MTADVTVSRAEPADAPAILELQKLAYQSEARLYQDWSIPPLTQTLGELQAEFAVRAILKACLGERLVGSVRAACDGVTCTVGRLIVHPDHQRCGIGTRLMRAIEALFPDAERCELFTGERSEDNIRLYRRLGYRVFRVEQLSPKVALVFMEKPSARTAL